jgi:hypothetical protein
LNKELDKQVDKKKRAKASLQAIETSLKNKGIKLDGSDPRMWQINLEIEKNLNKTLITAVQ